jgi:hypothetical protein
MVGRAISIIEVDDEVGRLDRIFLKPSNTENAETSAKKSLDS